jgi:hypothetical protein
MSYWRASDGEQTCKRSAPQLTNKHNYSLTAVREAYLALEREANKVGFKITESKTKFVIKAGKSVGRFTKIGDKTLEVLNEFVWLYGC